MADQTEKTDDKKMIEIEEQMNIINADAKTKVDEGNAENTSIVKPENREGMEVKPKKIPIGGIQMPGFFTRSRSKEKCKEGEGEQGDVEDVELLDPTAKKDDSLMSQARIKLPNPFRKSKAQDDEKTEGSERVEKKKLMGSIRLPLVSVRKKKGENLENQSATAGLASSETLDDNDKTADKGDANGMKTVPLNEKDAEKLEEEELDWKEKLKTYRLAISAFLLFILVMIVIIAITCSGSDLYNGNPKNRALIQTITSCGKIEGILDDGGIAFRGIPYARPPLGELRFEPAQPINDLKYCWDGVFLAHNATDYCTQIYSNGTVSGTEDCLTLDVVTPYVRYENPLPVVVLIGAESLIGGSPGKMRPSSRYARSKDVVFVRPNFRLGALGFLALETISKSTNPQNSGNYGLSDIVEALRWIQLNIQHFGGNKSAVTVFGHRAGATLVTSLATMKGAEKLFARAWATSGGALYPEKELSESEDENKSYLTSVNCNNLECLRKKSPEALTNAIEDIWRKPQPDLPMRTEVPEKRHEWLVFDGKVLKNHPKERWMEEEAIKVKLVLGTTAHSAASQSLWLKYTNWSGSIVVDHVNQSIIGEMGIMDDAMRKYDKTYRGLTQMISDIRVVCPLLNISAEMHNVPFYIVTQTRGEQDLADVESDVDAILGRYEPKTPEQRRYVSTMQQMFYHFVYHGEIHHKDKNKKLLIVGQDAAADTEYSHCQYWTDQGLVPKFAQLD